MDWNGCVIDWELVLQTPPHKPFGQIIKKHIVRFKLWSAFVKILFLFGFVLKDFKANQEREVKLYMKNYK